MKKFFPPLAISLFCVFVIGVLMASEPVPMIFDTDMGNDVDDALALAILHSAIDRGEVDLRAVTLTKSCPAAAEYVEMVNAWYHHPNIPVGLTDSGKTPDEGGYLRKVLDEASERFSWEKNEIPNAVTLLRSTLAAAEDHSIVIAQVGFSTNLANLLDTPADEISPLTGKELAAQKVKVVIIMGGGFVPETATMTEYNICCDVDAATKLASEWPGPLEYSGFEIGLAVEMPGVSIQEDYDYVDWHPIASSYYHYKGCSDGDYKSTPTWDLTCVLKAIRPNRGYFTLGEPGDVTVFGKGQTRFTPNPEGNARIFQPLTEVQAARIQEAFVWLCSEPAQK